MYNIFVVFFSYYYKNKLNFKLGGLSFVELFTARYELTS